MPNPTATFQRMLRVGFVRALSICDRAARLTPLARAAPASPASKHTTPGVIEIELEAAHVRVRGAVDATALRTVLEALAKR